MRYAIISDIHGNLAAFQAVLQDVGERGEVERIWCLGDIVGYGPDPGECIELLRSYDHICVAGNHDWGAIGKIDIDDFKIYNDTYGHMAGDQALKKMARIFTELVRKVDIVARYGGEEFAIILPQTAKPEAVALARRIRSMVEQIKFQDKSGNINVTVSVSIGVATYPVDASGKKELIAKADDALYHAKNHGKNRICSFSDKREFESAS